MTRRRLPLHPRPLSGEALSSWLLRLARAYRLDLHTFLVRALGVDVAGVPQGTLDLSPPVGVIETLADRTGVAVERIQAMTLAAYTPLLIDALRPQPGLFRTYVARLGVLTWTDARACAPVRDLDEGRWLPWITADLLNHEQPTGCRRCLVEDAVPYTRLCWRAGWMASCPVHGECFETGYLDERDPSWSYAWKPAEPAPPALTFVDGLTLSAVTTGAVRLANGWLHAGLWLRLLRALVDELTRPTRLLRGAAYGHVLHAWREAGFAQRAVHGAFPPFESLAPDRRKTVLTVAGHLLRHLGETELAELTLGQQGRRLPLLPAARAPAMLHSNRCRPELNGPSLGASTNT